MRLVHDPAGGESRTLAADVEVADSVVSRARGLMFRRRFPEALVFEFGRVRRRGLHMLFVAAPIDAVWVAEGTVTRVARLRPWVGVGRGRGDVVVELPAGGAEGVEPGDGLRVVTDNL